MEIKERDNLKSVYKNLQNVFCPYLQSEVVFNNKGFMHLLYKSGSRKRDLPDIHIRLKYLNEAREVLKITTTVQELEQKTSFEKNVHYFGFIAVVKNIKLKIVVRKENENGNYHFYSVIPHFVTSPKRDSKIINP